MTYKLIPAIEDASLLLRGGGVGSVAKPMLVNCGLFADEVTPDMSFYGNGIVYLGYNLKGEQLIVTFELVQGFIKVHNDCERRAVIICDARSSKPNPFAKVINLSQYIQIKRNTGFGHGYKTCL